MTSRDHLRIGDAERDEVMNALREHFAKGRLTHDELDERLGAALSARTAGDLRQVTADLPGPSARLPVEDDRWRAGGWAPPLPPHPADLSTWGHHLTAARHAPIRRWHHGRPPIFLFVFGALLIASMVTGSLWPLLGMLKVLLLAWLVFTVFRVARHHHRHHHHPLGRRF